MFFPNEFNWIYWIDISCNSVKFCGGTCVFRVSSNTLKGAKVKSEMADVTEVHSAFPYGDNMTSLHGVNITIEEVYYLEQNVNFWQVRVCSDVINKITTY